MEKSVEKLESAEVIDSRAGQGDGWPRVRIGDLGKIVRGSGIKRSETVLSGFPCLRYGEIYTSYEAILDKPRSFVTKEVFDNSLHIRKGDLVFTLTGETKEEIAKTLAYLGEEEIAAGGDLAVWSDHGCDPRYLSYLMYTPELIRAKALASNGQIIVHISVKKFQQIEIPLPPLAEQKAIVARLERELAAVDKMAKGFAEMESVAEAEFKAELKECFEEVSRRGAETQRLGDVFRFIDYRGKTPTKISSGVPLITAKNIRQGFLDYRERYFISQEEFATRQTRGVARKGDLLFTTEAPMGYVAVADLDVFSTGQRVITFQWPDESIPHENKYFLYYFLSDTFQIQLKENASGATAQGIKASRLVNLLVPMLSLKCQTAIVIRLDTAKARKDKLVAAARQGLETATLLRKAILKEAFA